MRKILLGALALFNMIFIYAQQPAFPTAEGFGRYAKGGRGGEVYMVTNLNDSGTGSLRWAIEQKVPRTIIFKVSGTIELKNRLEIKNPFVTIAGQTAPGDGICLKGETLRIATHDVIVRYIRVRVGDGKYNRGGSNQGKDAIDIASGTNIIVDHCSVSWSLDELLSTSSKNPDLDRVSVQWCFITEALNPANHGFGSLIRGTGGAKYSYHHNLYANNRGRNPRPGNYDSNPHEKDPQGLLLDFSNNVIYNWGGSHAGYNADKESVTLLNYTDNYLIPGQDSEEPGFAYTTGSPYNRAYFSGNYYNGKLSVHPWELVKFNSSWTDKQVAAFKQDKPFDISPVQKEDVPMVYKRILESGGAALPKRDAVDSRVVNDIIERKGKIIESPEQVGGWPQLNSVPAPIDSDNDGIPDLWEQNNGLDPQDAGDRNKITADGYTMLEKYINSIKLQSQKDN